MMAPRTVAGPRPVLPGVEAMKSLLRGVLEGRPPVGREDAARELTTLLRREEAMEVCPRRALGIERGDGQSLCPCAHAERNAIDTAARMGHPTSGCAVYVSVGVPCADCAYSIVGAGITECIVEEVKEYDRYWFSGLQVLRKCGVKVRTYAHREV